MRILIRIILAAGTLIIAAASPAATQTYECVTTTTTVTIYWHDAFGNYYITTGSRSSTVCRPIEQ